MATKTKAAKSKKAAPKDALNRFPKTALTGLRQAAAALAKASKRAAAKKAFTKEEVLALQAMISEGNAKLDEFLRIAPQGPDPEQNTTGT
jgi:hypothetical protein